MIVGHAQATPPATDEEQTVLNHSTILPERPLKGAACGILYLTHVTKIAESDNEILKAVSVRDAVERGVTLLRGRGGGDGWRHFF